MANLNFQQPPRSIANPSINNRGGGVTGNSFGSGGASSLSGHVTPTSSMFPQSSATFAPQSQLSPSNRSGTVQLTGGIGGPTIGSGSATGSSQAARANIFGQRGFADRRMQGLGPMVIIIELENILIYSYVRK